MGKTLICSIPFHCPSELHSMKKTSEDSFKKVFFPKFNFTVYALEKDLTQSGQQNDLDALN